jgi:hypothetical protein
MSAPSGDTPWNLKHAVFIVSAGRTGTQFLARALPQMIDDCAAFHEPDTLWLDRPWEYFRSVYWEQVRRHGLYHMTLGQTHATATHLATARYKGTIDDAQATAWFDRLRGGFIGGVPESIFVESNGLLWGVIDLILERMPNSKVIMVVREPRAWIRSAVLASHFRAFKFPDFDFLGFSPRPYYRTPVAHDKTEWASMSRPDKYTWLYGMLNQRLIDVLAKNPRALIVRYEDLFEGGDQRPTFERLLHFSSRFADGFSRPTTLRHDLVDRPMDSTQENGGDTSIFTPDEALVERHCGGIMDRFAYR